MIAHVARGATNIVPESGGFDADEVVSVFAGRTGTSMFAAPTMIKRLMESGRDFDPATIRRLIWGGAPMHVADIRRALDRFGPRLAQIYGQGESPMTITTLSRDDIADQDHPDWLSRLQSAGAAYACVDVVVADDDGRPLPVGETGEILVRGDTVMPGYWNNPEATAAALKDGWLYTGDVGAFDAAGYLTLKDRSKDVIISGGSNIYPREVEEVLLRHDAGSGSLRYRSAGSRMGRGGGRLLCGRGRAGGARRPVSRRDRPVQAAEGLRPIAIPAQKQLR